MKKYRIFISYSRADLEILIPIVQLLRITKDSIFHDVEDIRPGSHWRLILSDAINTCETLLLFWCNHSSKSDSVKVEYSQAIKLNKKIVPVILDDTPLPATLQDYQWIDLRKVLGNHEGYVTEEVKIPNLLPGPTKTEKMKMWKLIIPDEYTIQNCSFYLNESLGKILHID